MPSILSIVPGFNDPYVPYSESNTIPKLLTSLFREDLLTFLTQVIEKYEEVGKFN